MKHLKLFFACLLMSVLSIGQMWATDPSVKSTFSTSSTVTDNKVTENGVTWTLTTSDAVGSPAISTGTASSIQGLKFGSSGSNYFGTVKFSTDYFKDYNVKSVTIYEKNNGSKIGTLTVKQGSTTIGTASHSAKTSDWATLTASGTTGAGGTLEVTYEVAQASYFNYIEVVYEEAGCTNEITITKGDDPANGTFVIDNSGTVCIDGGNATVNVTATPSPGYHLATVTSDAGTVGDIDGNTCAITGINASTTINVTFTENPKYTVSFNVGGSTGSQADITETTAGAGITLPAGPTPTCSADGWVFAGWKETAGVAEQTTTAPTLLAAGANYKPAANCTLYAVYKKVEAGSGESGFKTFTHDLTNFPTGYAAAADYIIAGCTLNIKQVYANGKMQWRSSSNSAGAGVIYNKSIFPAKISSIVLTYTTGDSGANIELKVGDSANPTNGTSITPSVDGDVQTFDCSTANADYFVLTNGNGVGCTSSIVINYGASSTTYYLSAPTCTPPAVENPTFSPVAGEYEGAQNVTLACETDGATIYYTTNGNDPVPGEEGTSVYSAAINVSATQTIKAFAKKDDKSSEIVSATYTIITDCEAPTFSLAEGAYEGTQSVELECATNGATIYYTTNGNDPVPGAEGTFEYYTAISVSASQTIKAFAAKTNLNNSAIVSATYTISAGPDVTLNLLDEGWGFPYDNKVVSETSYQNGDYTIKVAGTSGDGFKTYGTYFLLGKNGAYIELPVFTLPIAKVVVSGGSSQGSTNVSWNIYQGSNAVSTAATGCTGASYTFEIAEANQKASVAHSIKVASSHNLQISVIKIYFGEAPAVEAPSISGDAAFVGSQDVTIACGTTGATIYYTTDGTDPKTSETKNEYTAAFTLDHTATVKAIANLGSDWSAVAEKSFTATPLRESIDELLTAIGTETAKTNHFVKITNWYVTATTKYNAYLSDGTNGILLYLNGHGFAVGDKLNKAQLQVEAMYYTDGAYAELTDLAASAFEGEELVNGQTITPVVKTATEFATLTNANQGVLYTVNNLTYDATNGKFVDANANEIAYYNKFSIDESALVDGHKYNVTGVAVYYKPNEGDPVVQLCPRTAADLVDNTAYVQIEFNANTTGSYGGTLPTTITNHISGTDYTIPAASLSRTDGYYQLGWNTDPTATVALATLTNVTASQTLYAIWKETENCTITFYSKGTQYTQKVVAQNAAYDFSDVTAPTAQGYTFAGWSESEISGEEASATILDSYTPTASTKDLYAVFSRKVDGETTTQYEKVTTAPASWEGNYLLVYENSATQGYVWDGTDANPNYKTATIATGVIATKPADAALLTIAAYSTGHSILINGGANDGKYLYDNGKNTTLLFNDNAYATTISCETEGTQILFSQRSIRYMDDRFRFYSDEKALGWLYRENTVTPQSDVYTTAPEIRYTVSFVLANDESGIFNDISVVKGQNQELPTAVPTKEHYTFNKWSDGVNEYAAGATIENVQDDIELHATWTEKLHATVSYNLNGAEGSIAPVEVYAGETYYLEDAPVWGENIFKGWSDGTEVHNAGKQMTMGETPAAVTYTAQWTTMLPIPASVPAFDNGVWVKESDEANLAAGDYVMVVALEQEFALGTTQNNNNRSESEITKIETTTDSVITYETAPAFLFLQNGLANGHYGLYDMNGENGYLYAATNGSNHLRTQASMNVNSSWKIEIDNEGVASIVAENSINNNVMLYNGGSSIFSCYTGTSSTVKDVTIYRFQEGKHLYKVDYKVGEDIVKTVYTITDAITVETIDEKATWTDGENHYTAGTEIALTENLVLTYEVPVYTVTFNSNEGSAVNPANVEEGQTVAKPEDPTRDGFNFVEWQLNSVAYDFTTPVTADITLDAIWEAVTPPTPEFETVRPGLTVGYYYTMCLEKAVTAVQGGTIWRVLSKAENGTDVILEEVTGTLEAGRPYIFNATDATLQVIYTGEAVNAPLTEGNNGLVGSFTEEVITPNPNYYILYNNALYYVEDAGATVKVGEHRAYLDMTGVPAYNNVTPAPGVRRVHMAVYGEQTATGVDNVQGDNVQSTKLLINGQLFILRGEKMYNANGQLVK